MKGENLDMLNDFMISKFSDWLKDNRFDFTLTEVKGGWLLKFNNPSEKLVNHIKNLHIEIDTGREDPKTHIAIRESVSCFTTSGDTVVIEGKYKADILNALYSSLRDYRLEIVRESL